VKLSGVVSSLAELGKREARPTWLAIGMFDGVHLGHRAVLELAVKEAKQGDDLVAALTFPEHPAKFLRPGEEPPLIMDARAKSEALLACGIDCVVMKPFDDSLAGIASGDFLGYLNEQIPSLRGICVGENFQFGKDRQGNANFLKENGASIGLKVCIAEGVLDGDWPISSSRIRESLAKGEIESANQMLGFPYRVDGQVVPGNQLGRTIGFPTLNLPWVPEARPAYGVYLVEVFFPGKAEPVHGVANYGLRPTVEQEEVREPLFDVHLLGHGDYSVHQSGDSISLSLLRFIRPEKKFDSLDALKMQIARDKAEAEKLVGEL
jgi:riboflavin kinase/FMN adenylyltransferase